MFAAGLKKTGKPCVYFDPKGYGWPPSSLYHAKKHKERNGDKYDYYIMNNNLGDRWIKIRLP